MRRASLNIGEQLLNLPQVENINFVGRFHLDQFTTNLAFKITTFHFKCSRNMEKNSKHQEGPLNMRKASKTAKVKPLKNRTVS